MEIILSYIAYSIKVHFTEFSLTYSDMTISVIYSLYPSLVIYFNIWNNFLYFLLIIYNEALK